MKRYRTKFVQYDSLGNLMCYKCGKYLSVDCYDINTDRWYRDGKDNRCKECKKEQREKRRLQNRGDQGIERLLTERYCGVKERAKRNGLELDFDKDYLRELWVNQDGKCAISGIQMTTLVFCGRVPTNISIDRIDSTKGYIKGNVHLVCMAINQMKSDMSLEQLMYFCKQIINNNGNTY